MSDVALQTEQLTKRFRARTAVDRLTMRVERGDIYGFLGPNGAGKSTLMNILTGLHKQDKGTIKINGVETVFKNSLEAERSGLAFIRQELNIWPEMTVLENLFIGRELTNAFGVLKTKEMQKYN